MHILCFKRFWCGAELIAKICRTIRRFVSRYPPPEFLPKNFREFWKFRQIFENAIKKIRMWQNLYGTPYVFFEFSNLFKKSYGTPYDFFQNYKYCKIHMVPPILFSKFNMKKVAFLFQNIPKNSWNVFRYSPSKMLKNLI